MFSFTRQPEIDAAEEFSELVRRYGDIAYRMACQLTGGREAEAGDLVQEVFLRIWRRWPEHRPNSIKGWMYRVLHNLYLDAMRRQARYPLDSLESPRGEDSTLGDTLADKTLGADQSIERSDTCQEVSSALNQLDVEFRLPVVLCDMEGLPYEDISRILNCPIGTVRSRIHRGRTQLRRLLKKRTPEEIAL
jgi:RNA polymerase sigma-70 factor (ECF subfamily)